MLNLLRKDFIAGALFLSGVIILIPFLSSIALAAMVDDFGGINMSIYTLIIICLCVGSSLLFIALDTSFKTDATYASLPLKRSTIVGARYVSSIIITVAGFLLVVLSCMFAVKFFKLTDPGFSVILDLRGIISMISLVLIILAFMLPFAFKFGPGKGAIAALIAQIVLVLLVSFIGFIQYSLKGVWNFYIVFFSKILIEILVWIAKMPGIFPYLFTFSIVFTFTTVSLILSIRFYNKRDL